MSELILSRTYSKKGNNYAYATFTDFSHGEGLLQIHSDFGIYHSDWGATGAKYLEEFVLSSDVGYLINNFSYWQRYMGCKKTHMGLLDKFIINCWPELREIIKAEFEAFKHTEVENEKRKK